MSSLLRRIRSSRLDLGFSEANLSDDRTPKNDRKENRQKENGKGEPRRDAKTQAHNNKSTDQRDQHSGASVSRSGSSSHSHGHSRSRSAFRFFRLPERPRTAAASFDLHHTMGGGGTEELAENATDSFATAGDKPIQGDDGTSLKELYHGNQTGNEDVERTSQEEDHAQESHVLIEIGAGRVDLRSEKIPEKEIDQVLVKEEYEQIGAGSMVREEEVESGRQNENVENENQDGGRITISEFNEVDGGSDVKKESREVNATDVEPNEEGEQKSQNQDKVEGVHAESEDNTENDTHKSMQAVLDNDNETTGSQKQIPESPHERKLSCEDTPESARKKASPRFSRFRLDTRSYSDDASRFRARLSRMPSLLSNPFLWTPPSTPVPTSYEPDDNEGPEGTDEPSIANPKVDRPQSGRQTQDEGAPDLTNQDTDNTTEANSNHTMSPTNKDGARKKLKARPSPPLAVKRIHRKPARPVDEPKEEKAKKTTTPQRSFFRQATAFWPRRSASYMARAERELAEAKKRGSFRQTYPLPYDGRAYGPRERRERLIRLALESVSSVHLAQAEASSKPEDQAEESRQAREEHQGQEQEQWHQSQMQDLDAEGQEHGPETFSFFPFFSGRRPHPIRRTISMSNSIRHRRHQRKSSWEQVQRKKLQIIQRQQKRVGSRPPYYPGEEQNSTALLLHLVHDLQAVGDQLMQLHDCIPRSASACTAYVAVRRQADPVQRAIRRATMSINDFLGQPTQ